MSDDLSEEPVTYAIRITERAQRDIDLATVHFAETASEETAIAWREGLNEWLGTLATFPRRCPRAPERFKREVRQGIYRRPGSRVNYRILFSLDNEDADALDAPMVVILHIRHSAARPLTRSQILEIENN